MNEMTGNLRTAIFLLSILSFFVPSATGFKLRILHTNDMHSRFEQISKNLGKCTESASENNLCYGGFARLKTAIDDEFKKAKEENITTLFLNAGDNYQGTIYYTTLANSGELKFIDEIEALTKEATRLHNEGIKIIIAVGHSGYDVDMEIAAKVPYLDVIVGGHSHTFLYSGTPPDIEVPVREYPIMIKQKNGRLVPIVQAFCFTKYLGKIDITFDDDGEVTSATGNPILLNYKYKEDVQVLRELNKWKEKLSESLIQNVGVTKVLLDATECRFSETNIGNLITDAFIYHAVKNNTGKYWTQAPIAIQQGGGIRASINVTGSNGVLTREDIMTTMPFFTSLSMVKMNGKTLHEGLEWSVAQYSTERHVGRGQFLHMSGMKVKYDLNKNPGSRVTSVSVRCAFCDIPRYNPLNMTEEYTVLMPTFLKLGGDNFTMFKYNGTEILRFG
ncbi:conserved hypothetical protein [Pediculus humanus corporis]|uniref:5'-nucleotidase n=1 Tax=Pediculus humanus subsp. corporis TaxID=121224 RepID=E0VD87_PEDHC|nr:uncharacterized protein Phum_PHUM106700 [Pediculus humanus corporis]EEB11343.1 conserved hypothetical protein [Pediculus humanus corporis]